MRPIRQYFQLIRHMGPGWVAYRAFYAIQKRSGMLRRKTPPKSWSELPAPQVALNTRPLPRIEESWGNACLGEAEAILRGQFRLFSLRVVDAGFPPQWNRNQLTGEEAPAAAHWSELGDFAFGDIKGVWELSRFPWAFALARAYARTRDERFASAFWTLFADWCEKNPPNRGPNWMCGQEATFRLMAVVFAVDAIGVPAERRDLFSRFVVASGQRIAANLSYALSQKNNHGISECVGLITCGLLLGNFGDARRWRDVGLRSLQRQVAELVYEDGGFSQHSLIYHRVMLDDLCWVCSRLNGAGRPVPAWLTKAGKRATGFLRTLVDPETGQAPLYGTNDGANVLPLADADFLDMRPVVQAAAALFESGLPMPPGPWNEAARWLRRDTTDLPPTSWPGPQALWIAPVSGCAQLVHGSDRLFLRCPSRYRHRPAQADMSHVEVWSRGRPVVHDGGSFSYNSAERFTALSCARFHNVVTVDDCEPMEKFGRFLYLPWPRGTIAVTEGAVTATHDGYAKRGVAWARTVARRAEGGFVVKDAIRAAAGASLRWHWRLCDGPWMLDNDGQRVILPADDLGYVLRWHGPTTAVRLVRADRATALGWWSPHYGAVAPACSLIIETRGADRVDFTMEFVPGKRT